MKTLAIITAAMLAVIGLAGPAAAVSKPPMPDGNYWMPGPGAVRAEATRACFLLDPAYCVMGTPRLVIRNHERTIDTGVLLFRKTRKGWVPVPVKYDFTVTPPAELSIYPLPAKFTPGTYIAAVTNDQDAQWKCSPKFYQGCIWTTGGLGAHLYQFDWTGQAVAPNVTFGFRSPQ